MLGRGQLKRDGTRWRTGREVKRKLANGGGNQCPSHYLGTWCIQHYYSLTRTPGLPVVDWTDAPVDLNGLVRFAERRNLVSARVPSHFSRSLRYKYFQGSAKHTLLPSLLLTGFPTQKISAAIPSSSLSLKVAWMDSYSEIYGEPPATEG
jgi:hypothetical protein